MIFKILASDALVIKILGSFLILFLSVEFIKRKTVTNSITMIKLDINEEIKSNNQIEDNVNESKILLYFKDECWIEIYSNEKLIEYQLFNSEDNFSMTIKKPFTIVVGNAEAVVGSYEGSNIDFITNANRLRVNTIIFNDE